MAFFLCLYTRDKTSPSLAHKLHIWALFFAQAVDDTVRSTAREYSQPLVQFNSHISVILKEHVRPERAADFETAINNLGSAANAFTGEAFVGTTVVRPSSGSNVYTVILRFTNKEALQVPKTGPSCNRFCCWLLDVCCYLVQKPGENSLGDVFHIC